MKKIISVIGTRPNFIKIAPLCSEFIRYSDRVQHKLCHTGQHSDDKMSGVFFDDLGMPVPDFHLGISNGTHAEQTAGIMDRFEKVLVSEQPDLVIVVGDVNSTVACALAAVKLHIPVAHVEAGLRSGDKTMPEEINRLVTDTISDLLFVTEHSGIINLANEGVPEKKVFFTGNIMIDSLVRLEGKILSSTVLETFDLMQKAYFLVTFHRPSNVDNTVALRKLLLFLADIASRKTVVFPIHPRTRRNIIEFGLQGCVPEDVRLIEPLGYLEFQALLRQACMIITDSGGIQEETTFLGIPCVTVRDNTERPVTVDEGTNFLCGTDLLNAMKVVEDILSGNMKKGKIPELWDGKAAARIVKHIIDKIGE